MPSLSFLHAPREPPASPRAARRHAIPCSSLRLVGSLASQGAGMGAMMSPTPSSMQCHYCRTTLRAAMHAGRPSVFAIPLPGFGSTRAPSFLLASLSFETFILCCVSVRVCPSASLAPVRQHALQCYCVLPCLFSVPPSVEVWGVRLLPAVTACNKECKACGGHTSKVFEGRDVQQARSPHNTIDGSGWCGVCTLSCPGAAHSSVLVL